MRTEAAGDNEPAALYERAVAAFQTGDAVTAESLCRKILAQAPDKPGAWHLLGIAKQRLGHHAEAVEAVRRAVELAPSESGFLNTLGFLLRHIGQQREAVGFLEKAVALRPEFAEAWSNLGIARAECRDQAGAKQAYLKAIDLRPDFAEAYNNLGNLYAATREIGNAIQAFEKAIEMRPDYAEAIGNLGDAQCLKARLLRSRHPDDPRFPKILAQARANCVKAVELLPDWADAHFKLGTILELEKRHAEAGQSFRNCVALNPVHIKALKAYAAILERLLRVEEAASHLRQALIVKPNDVAALRSLGHIALKLGNAVEALHLLEHAKKLAPADPDTIYSYANVLLRLDRLQEAMDNYLRVRELQPNQARGTFAPAAVLLMDGQFEKGWAAYEARFGMASFRAVVKTVTRRLWDGGPLPEGGTLMVHTEQGFGDTLQFVRYLPLVKKRLGRKNKVVLVCEPQLHPLLEHMKGFDGVYSSGDAGLEVAYQAQVPMLSLPHRMGTVLETIPADVPYLSVPAAARVKLPKPSRKVERIHTTVVFAWAGRPSHSDDRYRTIPFEIFERLFDVPGVAFHSLQLGEPATALAPIVASRPAVFDPTPEVRNFLDSAAIVLAADLVISADTALAHLAGGLGKPVWTLLPYGGEWRWLRGREDSPWYPTMRLFRQRVFGDWAGVVDRVAAELARRGTDKG